jgi:hypothetical protein
MRAPLVVGSLLIATMSLEGCRTAEGERIPRSLPGTYAYDAGGRVLGHPWSFDVTLELRRNGRYEMMMTSDIDGDRDVDHERGRYLIREGVLLLDDDDGDERADEPSHKLDIRGDSLVSRMPWGARAALRLAGAPRPILVRRDRASN